MNKEQLESLVVVPALMEIPHGYSDDAVLAIMMIIAHESARAKYIKQVNGPALGLIQMEPLTHDDVWAHSDTIWNNAALLGIVTENEAFIRTHPPASRLIYDLRYNVFMARQRLFMDVNPLPSDKESMSKYLKGYWNSNAGAASQDSYLNDYEVW